MIARLLRLLRSGSVPALMILGAVVGLGAGLGAVLLIEMIGWVRSAADWLAGSGGLDRTWMFLTVPVGLWISWRLTSWFAPEVAGHGVPQILAALTVRGGRMRTRVAPLKAVATALTIGSGGSAGREGSIAQIGAGLGSWLGRITKLGENDVRALVAAGAGAGISATFNAPIAGMFFALEVILRSFSVRHLQVVMVASVAGAVVSNRIIGEELTFVVPSYGLADPRELGLYALMALVTVGAAWFYLEMLDWWELAPDRLHGAIRPLVLGVVVALIGFARPEALGTGQQFTNEVLRNAMDMAWYTLALLALLKAVATSATLGGKGSGGIFMPSLFIGASAGAAFAQLVAPAWSVSNLNAGAFALVGMAATFSAVARAPLTSVLIVFEVTGDYGLVLPLMIATSIATYLAGRVRPESAYSAPLSRMGIHPARASDVDLLDSIEVGEVTTRQPMAIPPVMTTGNVDALLTRHRLHGVPVVEDGALVGIITVTDIIRAGGPSDSVTARESMTPNPVTVTPDTPVSEALERMAALGVGRLPVVRHDDATVLVGMFRREDAINAYHHALSASARQRHPRHRSQVPTKAGARFYEFEIPDGSPAAGRLIKEFAWPEGCLLVSVNRGADVMIAGGNLRLRPGDAITAFGSEESRRRLAERLAVRESDAADG